MCMNTEGVDGLRAMNERERSWKRERGLGAKECYPGNVC